MARYKSAALVAAIILVALFFIGPRPDGSPSLAAITNETSNDSSDRLRFAVIGDQGTGDAPQLAIARQMLAEYEREKFPLVVMLGDNIYGSGRFDKIEAVFNIPYRPLLERGVKFYATLGNHDQLSAAEQIDYDRFNMDNKRAYSFTPAGKLVEFFTIDSTPLHAGKLLDQLEWLDRALKDSKARWKIAFFHHPPYSPGRRHGDNPVMLARVVPILQRHKVRVVLCGHEHFFAKLHPKDGIDYIISGAAGKIHRGGLRLDHPYLEAGNDRLHHFLIVTLTEEAFDYSAIANTGETIYRGRVSYAPGN